MRADSCCSFLFTCPKLFVSELNLSIFCSENSFAMNWETKEKGQWGRIGNKRRKPLATVRDGLLSKQTDGIEISEIET